jgi:hypothetical protein
VNREFECEKARDDDENKQASKQEKKCYTKGEKNGVVVVIVVQQRAEVEFSVSSPLLQTHYEPLTTMNPRRFFAL